MWVIISRILDSFGKQNAIMIIKLENYEIKLCIISAGKDCYNILQIYHSDNFPNQQFQGLLYLDARVGWPVLSSLFDSRKTFQCCLVQFFFFCTRIYHYCNSLIWWKICLNGKIIYVYESSFNLKLCRFSLIWSSELLYSSKSILPNFRSFCFKCVFFFFYAPCGSMRKTTEKCVYGSE